MLLLPYKKSLLSLFICILLISGHGLCRTPDDLDRVITEFKKISNPDDQLKIAYLGLDIYAAIPQKSEVDPDDRVVLSLMKRIVLKDAMSRAGKNALVTAVGTTGYWVLEQQERIVNDYDARDQERIVELKRKGSYMEGLSDLDFVIMGPDAAVYQGNLFRILSQGIDDVRLIPEELERLEISFITDEQVKDLSPGSGGRNFWNQLMNLEAASPHPEKYITKGGKALYGMEHLFEEGAVAVSNQGNSPGLFREYADKSGHRMGPFVISHLFGGSCDMDYFIRHTLVKKRQEGVKTVLQVMKYLKRQEWMLRRAAKNINQLPAELPKKPEAVKSLENYASEIAAFNNKAVNQMVWKSPEATASFGKQAQELSGLICSFAHESIIETGDTLLNLREKNRLTDETRALLSSIVFDLVTVDEERYSNGYPSWYANSVSVAASQAPMPRDKTLDFLKRYFEGKSDHMADGPVIAIPEVRKKKKMDTGPIRPPPVASVEINEVKVSPEKPLAGAPVTFNISGKVSGISKEMPDFAKNEYSASQQKIMEELGMWSLRATIHRMQIQYLMEQDLLGKKASSGSGPSMEPENQTLNRASSSLDKIYVSPYEITRITEDYLEPAEDEIARLSEELDRAVTDKQDGRYALRVRPVPSVRSIKDYQKALEDTIKQAKWALDIINNFVYHFTASLEITTDNNETRIFVTDQGEFNTVWNEDGTYTGTNRYDSRQDITRESLAVRLAEFRENTQKGINYVDKAIEYTEEIKKRVDQLDGLLKRDPSTAAEIAAEIQGQLEVLAATTSVTIKGVQDLRVRLVEGVTDAHLYVSKYIDTKNDGKYSRKVRSLVKEWKVREKELSEKTLPDLEKKEIWLRRGAWAAWGAKWGFEALSIYQKYEEDKASLTSTDLSAEMENAVLALSLIGKAIEKIVDLIPIPILESTLKSYAKLLSDASTWASAMDSLQAMRYQDQDFEIRMVIPPAAYKTLMQKYTDLDSDQFYRTRMPLAEYNGLTILAYPRPEPTETGAKKRHMMWLIWDKHNPAGYLFLDKNTFEKLSLYTAWYRRVYGENISGENLYALITKGKFETGYIFKETVTPDSLRFKAATLLRIKALEAYCFSLTGKGKFKEEELYTYMSMLYHASGEFARNGFLLSDPDVKEIMEAVFFEKPISGAWETVFDIFTIGTGNAVRINDGAAAWDKISGGEKERLEVFLNKFIQKKVEVRAKEREKNWKEAKVREDSNTPVAAGLLFSETGLVFNHAFFSKAGDSYADDFLDINSNEFTISWKTTVPDDIDLKTVTYVCIAEIAGYPNTRIQFALPMDTLENDILKQMLELAEKAEEKGNSAWSACQRASSGVDAFEERKEDFLNLLEKLKKMAQSFDSRLQQAEQAPGILKVNSTEAERLSDLILKDQAEIEKLKTEICELSGVTSQAEKQRQTQLFQQLIKIMENIRSNFSLFIKLFEESDKALNGWKDFERMIKEYDALLNENLGWARDLSNGFSRSLDVFREVDKSIKELVEIKEKADTLLVEAKQVYSDPESAPVLQEIQNAYNRVERPLNELKDCLTLANEKKNQNLPFWETVNSELVKSELNIKKGNEKWSLLVLKNEDVETLAIEISNLWLTSQAQLLKAENNMADSEACMGEKTSDDSEARMPDLIGMDIAAAKNSVNSVGLKPVFRGGDPAPSDNQAYTVASQSPAADTILKKGENVTIILYGNFAGFTVPDVIGLSSKEAKEILEKRGFKVSHEGGDPAPDEGLKYKVQAQVPGAGERAEKGSIVRVRIYGDVHYVVVPSVFSMTSAQAKKTIASAGLIPSLFGGDPAPKKSMSYRVQNQSPEPGTMVPHGSRINIHVYGNFSQERALSDSNCNHLPGTILIWDDQNDRAACACPQGMVWNSANSACIKDPRIEEDRIRREQFWTGLAATAGTIIANEINRNNRPSGGNTTGGGVPGGSTSGGSTSTPTIQSGGSTPTPTTGVGAPGLSREECERKFCPECTNSVSLLGQSVSPQCMDCRKRKQNDIEKCMRGEKTGPGTQHVEKEYMVICYLNDKNECTTFDVVKTNARINGRWKIMYDADTWDKCHEEEERLRYLILQNNPLIRY
ncbi:MAG: PASTA domain-containing protein [Desulfatiglans sp.]|nr:PASTA domain-containing protein [Desulfatiglans sp.]